MIVMCGQILAGRGPHVYQGKGETNSPLFPSANNRNYFPRGVFIISSVHIGHPEGEMSIKEPNSTINLPPHLIGLTGRFVGNYTALPHMRIVFLGDVVFDTFNNVSRDEDNF